MRVNTERDIDYDRQIAQSINLVELGHPAYAGAGDVLRPCVACKTVMIHVGYGSNHPDQLCILKSRVK